MDCLEPLLRFPTNQVLESAAEALFGDTNSPWGKLPWKGAFGRDFVESDLAPIPAFRTLLIRELEKTNVCGSMTWRGSGVLEYQITDSQSGTYSAIDLGNDQPAIGATTGLRWCDWIDWSLSLKKPPPFFNPFAPVEKRDEEIRRTKTLLQQQ